MQCAASLKGLVALWGYYGIAPFSTSTASSHTSSLAIFILFVLMHTY